MSRQRCTGTDFGWRTATTGSRTRRRHRSRSEGTFTYKVQFPDAGFYWYHPHIREDFGLEMGLYGTIIVDPADPSYWPAVDRQLSMTLDDLLVENGHIAPFHRSGPNYTAMGRFGNVMLINGETRFSGKSAVGEVVRLYLVNTANTRIFNLALRGARMKLVGGDSGRYERETFVDEVMLAPSERAVLDVLFDTPGEARLEHRTPDQRVRPRRIRRRRERDGDRGRVVRCIARRPPAHRRASVDQVATSNGRPTKCSPSWLPCRCSTEMTMPPATSYACPMHPEVTSSEPGTCPKCGMQLLPVHSKEDPPASYACPMHPEVTSSEPGTCPKCGMKLLQVRSDAPGPARYVCPMHPEVTSSEPGTCPKCGMKLVPADTLPATEPKPSEDAIHEEHQGHEQNDGLEWEDLMPEINRASEPSNMRWMLIDRESGAENGAISWAFTVGDRVKIRLVNEMESDHPMHHPFHVHGAGRFLVLSRDGEPESNLVWKDTVLVPAGRTTDVLLDVSNPGLWMAHCHIAEHAQSGMMFSFNVARREPEVVS